MIKEFLDYQKARKGLSKNTIDAYRTELSQFVIWASEKGLRWSEIKKRDFDSYLTARAETGASRNSLIRTASVLRSLTTWAFHEGILPTNEAQYLQSPKREEKLAEMADTEALKRYLEKEATTARTERTQALIAFIMSTGARIQEALDAKLSDVDAKNWTIKLKGKGNKERTAYLQPWTLQYLSKVGNQRQGFVFPMKSQRTARYDMEKELEGYTQTHPHAIRHSFATTLLENGADIKAVSLLLGHQSVKTTERYLNTSNNYLKTQLKNHLNYGRETETTEKEVR